MASEARRRVEEATVWATLSLLVQRTVWPSLTTTTCGTNLMFFICTPTTPLGAADGVVFVALGADVLEDPPQPASARQSVDSRTTSGRADRFILPRCSRG